MGGDREAWARIFRSALLALLAGGVTTFVLGRNMAESAVARRPLVDVSSSVDIAGGNCSFGPVFDREFRNMISYDRDLVPSTRPVILGRQRVMPRLAVSRSEDVGHPGFRNHDSVARLHHAVRWNGLRLIGLRSSTGWKWGATSLEFADRPERVRAAMRAIGLELPLPPGSREIPLDACSAFIAIEARGSGAALVCSSGC